MAREPIVHIIDDDDAAHDSLAFLLQAWRFQVKSYGSASAFLDNLQIEQGDCLITDLRMPEIDGLGLLHRIASRQISIPVIVITGHGDVPLAIEAMRAGAVNFIEKPFDDETLLRAVQSALGDQSPEAKQSETKKRLLTLSPLERQVLEALAAGHSSMAIASSLQTGVPRVEVHRASIMTKMEARNFSHLL
jgi:two-component system response regulator FixJ